MLLSEGFNIVLFINELFLGGGFKWILGFALVLSLNEEDLVALKDEDNEDDKDDDDDDDFDNTDDDDGGDLFALLSK